MFNLKFCVYYSCFTEVDVAKRSAANLPAEAILARDSDVQIAWNKLSSCMFKIQLFGFCNKRQPRRTIEPLEQRGTFS